MQHVEPQTFETTGEIISPIQWAEKTLRLQQLRPFESNPRTITEAQFSKLKQSLQEDGYHSRIKVTPDFRVLGGHMRIRALQELGITEVPCLVASRALSHDEFKRILVRDNHSNGVFDMDLLSALFDLEELRGFGLHDVTGIPPIMGEEQPKASGAHVRCPHCQQEFPVKGHKV